MHNPSFLTLGEAAKLTGKDKAAVLYRINHKVESKRLPASKENGVWRIQVSDLEKFFKLKKVSVENSTPKQSSNFNEIQHLKLQHELELKNVEIQQLKDKLEEVKLSKEQFYELANRNSKMLIHYTDKEVEKNEEAEPQTSKSKWSWLWS